MKKITVYADFDFLASPQEIGTLGYERVRGKDHFVFEYSSEWLKQHGGIVLSGDLMNVPSLQHPRGTDSVLSTPLHPLPHPTPPQSGYLDWCIYGHGCNG